MVCSGFISPRLPTCTGLEFAHVQKVVATWLSADVSQCVPIQIF